MSETRGGWAAVAKALPLEPHRLNPDLVLSPIRGSDLNDLKALLANDPDNGWTPGGWTDGDVDFVLKLRLEHYERYNFGVFALRDADGSLMGMAGAQVWTEGPSDLEVVAFVGRKFWRHGLAHTALTYVIAKLAEAGVPRVLATSRPDNYRSAGMLTKLGFERAGVANHWSVDAVLWTLYLDRS